MDTTLVEDNPFTPSFGEVPLVMAGRGEILAEFDRSLSSAARRPSLTTLVSGARGTGKTALLTLVGSHAQERGWIVIDLVSLPGLLEDAYEQTRMRAQHLVNDDPATHLTSMTVGPVGIGVKREPETRPNWRSRMTNLLDQLAADDAGLLITIDELDPKLNELVQLVSTYQLFVREGYRVALMMAGLPHNTPLLLQDKSVSFLRRASSVKLGRIPDFEIEKALRETFAKSSRIIGKAVTDEAVRLIDGFPFMLQLVGFRMWEEGSGPGCIDDDRAREGMLLATEEMKYRILLQSYRDLSPMDRKFLLAMAQDEGDSKLTDVAQRLGKSNSYAAQYKNRLLEQGVIGTRESGRLGFELPVMREFLLERGDGR